MTMNPTGVLTPHSVTVHRPVFKYVGLPAARLVLVQQYSKPERIWVSLSHLRCRTDVRSWSLYGFEWGKDGTEKGIRQLALSIMCHHYRSDQLGLIHYGSFQAKFLSTIETQETAWSITTDKIESIGFVL